MRWLLAVLFIAASSRVAGASGKSIFLTNCSPCHQASGGGVPGAFPPLKDSVGRFTHMPAGRAYLVHVVSFGMAGPIASQGRTYNGFMQPWVQLTDADLADVLNYILTDFNKALLPSGFAPFTAAEVRTLRATHLSLDQVRHDREAVVKTLEAQATPGAKVYP